MLIENKKFNEIIKNIAELQKTYQTISVNLRKPDDLKQNEAEKKILDETYSKLFSYYNEEMEKLCEEFVKLCSHLLDKSVDDKCFHTFQTFKINWDIEPNELIRDIFGKFVPISEIVSMLSDKFPEFKDLPYTVDNEKHTIKIYGFITESQRELCERLQEIPFLNIQGSIGYTNYYQSKSV